MASPYWFVWKTVQCVISFRLQYFMCIISFIFIFRFECGFLHCIFVFSTVFSKGSAGYFLSWIYFPHTHCEHEPCFVDTTCIDLKTCWFVCLIWMFSYTILFVRDRCPARSLNVLVISSNEKLLPSKRASKRINQSQNRARCWTG